MTIWPERVKNNIFPVSEEQNNLKLALSEWVYEEQMYDLGGSIETCQLCDHEGIRYQYEITNYGTGHVLLIGSECVKRYDDIQVVSNGKRLTTIEAHKKVDADKKRMIANAKTKSVLNSLILLSRAEAVRNTHEPDQSKHFKIDFEDLEKYYKENGKFTPRQLFLVFWRFKENRINYKQTYFKATIKKKDWKEYFINMDGWKIESIWPALSGTQRKLVMHKVTNVTR